MSHGSDLHLFVVSQMHLSSVSQEVLSDFGTHESLIQLFPFQKQLLLPAHTAADPKNEHVSVEHLVSQRHFESVLHGDSEA